MSLGLIIRMIEGAVTVFCGVGLAVRPSKLRWDNKIAKAILGFLILLGMALLVGNATFTKFSSLEYIVIYIYLFIVLLTFYKINFWKLFAQNTIYWLNMLLLRFFVIFICCVNKRMTFYDYITYPYISWDWLHIVMMCIIIVLSLILYYKKRNKDLIEYKHKMSYFYISLLLIGEYLCLNRLSPTENAFVIASYRYIDTIGLIILLILVIGIFITIGKSYLDLRHQKQIDQMKIEMVENRYALLQKMFIEKRRQVHDSVQQNILICSYLKQGQVDEALNYLKDIFDKMSLTQKNVYSGIQVIDIMLDYKVGIAEQSDIQVKLDIDILFNPMKNDDICIVIGNLMDNAIEATINLDKELRIINVMMKTANNIFIMEITNPFEGKRKFMEGKYESTKNLNEMHGLGLESVSMIVNNYNSSLEVNEDGKFFEVILTIF